MSHVKRIFYVAAFFALLGADHFEDPATAVESGRKALDHWIDYPWYDDATDDVAGVQVQTATPDIEWPRLWEIIRGFGWLLLVVFLAAIVYLTFRAYFARETKPHHASRVSPTDLLDADRVQTLPFEVAQPLSDLLTEAERNYQAGRFEEAILYFFSYQLVELDKCQVIHLTRGKTNRQYLQETRTHSRLGSLLERTMVAFEDVFFGNHALSRARFEVCWSKLAEFDSELSSLRSGT